jgi:hypothetical protein
MNFDNTLTICGTIIAISMIVGITAYNINDRNLMAHNVDNAIAKGIDPMSVRCSYASERDMICMAFAASNKELMLQSTPSKK